MSSRKHGDDWDFLASINVYGEGGVVYGNDPKLFYGTINEHDPIYV